MTERQEPTTSGDERTTLIEFLDYYRGTLETKATGITDAQARTAAVEPSDLTILGLVRHFAGIERWWFREVFRGEELDDPFDSANDVDADLHPGPEVTLTESIAMWRNEVAIARDVVETASSFDVLAARERRGAPVRLRWIMVHMIEEYARHCGHADFLRERIDGQTGD